MEQNFFVVKGSGLLDRVRCWSPVRLWLVTIFVSVGMFIAWYMFFYRADTRHIAQLSHIVERKQKELSSLSSSVKKQIHPEAILSAETSKVSCSEIFMTLISSAEKVGLIMESSAIENKRAQDNCSKRDIKIALAGSSDAFMHFFSRVKVQELPIKLIRCAFSRVDDVMISCQLILRMHKVR